VKLRYAVPISVLLHLLVLIIATPTIKLKMGKKGGGDKQKQVEIIPAKITEVTMLDRTPGPSVKKKPIQKKRFKSTVACMYDSWFGGIGIQEDESRKRIDIVYPGYPAENAGLKADDTILSTDAPIRGDPGTVLNIVIFRPSSNETLTFQIIRDRICYGERKR